MKKAVWRIGVAVAENLVGEGRKFGVGLVVFVKAAGNLAILIRAEEQRLIVAGFGVKSV